MGNPWLDEEKARRWVPRARAGGRLRDEHTDTVIRLAGLHNPRRILDLGSGTGDLDARALDRYPEASITCLDGAPVMLERSRETLAPYGERARFILSDLGKDWRAAVGGGYDVVMSIQAIHHLPTWAKRSVYARCFDVLRPGGLLIVQERIAFDGRLWPHIQALWEARRKEEGVEPLGLEMNYDEWLAAEHAGGDFPEPLDVQCRWLHEIGFDPVDTFVRLADRVVFGGVKP
jgi:tRNA (cmo5U34)-methyltransferase